MRHQHQDGHDVVLPTLTRAIRTDDGDILGLVDTIFLVDDRHVRRFVAVRCG